MTEQPDREVAVLNAALELRPAERAAYLAQACAGDAALRRQVEALLQAHEQAEGFLEALPTGLDCKRTIVVDIPITEKPGEKLAATNCFNKSAREAAAWSIWPSWRNRSAAARRSRSSSWAWIQSRSWPATKPSGRRWR